MKPLPEARGIDTRPVLDSRGFVVLFDLYYAGQWVGSRRTVQQCEQWLTTLSGVEIAANMGGPW